MVHVLRPPVLGVLGGPTGRGGPSPDASQPVAFLLKHLDFSHLQNEGIGLNLRLANAFIQILSL